MRPYLYGLTIAAWAIFAVACQDTTPLTPDGASVELDRMVRLDGEDLVIIVGPSAAADPLVKAQEDWQNISAALEGAEPGDVVQLRAGLFYLHRSVVTWDFAGTLRGAGEAMTTIQTAPGVPFDVSEAPTRSFAANFAVEGNAMFAFPHQFNDDGRTVTISDLTIVASEPTTPWTRDVNGPSPTTHNNLLAVVVYHVGLDNDLARTVRLTVVFRDMAVEGVQDGRFDGMAGTNFSLAGGLAAAGAATGRVSVEGVRIRNATTGMAFHVWNGEGSTVSVRDSEVENAYRCINSEINHSWMISENEFVNCSRAAVTLIGPSNGVSTVVENVFGVSGGVGLTGIWARDVQVKEKAFTGSGFTGIFLRAAAGWEIAENDLCGLDVANGAGATILLMINTTSTGVEENAGQVVGGPFAGHLSNDIRDAKPCDEGAASLGG